VVKALGHIPNYTTPRNISHHLAQGRQQVYETDRVACRAPILMSDGEQILLVRQESADADESVWRGGTQSVS
jgi:hypothetical protein